MDICTICGQNHCAASCNSPMAGFLQKESGNAPATAEPATRNSESKESTQSTAAGKDTSLSQRLCTECGNGIDAAKLASTNNSYCRACQKAYSRRYYRQNKHKWGQEGPRY